jgi:hypothetical protein
MAVEMTVALELGASATRFSKVVGSCRGSLLEVKWR